MKILKPIPYMFETGDHCLASVSGKACSTARSKWCVSGLGGTQVGLFLDMLFSFPSLSECLEEIFGQL